MDFKKLKIPWDYFQVGTNFCFLHPFEDKYKIIMIPKIMIIMMLLKELESLVAGGSGILISYLSFIF